MPPRRCTMNRPSRPEPAVARAARNDGRRRKKTRGHRGATTLMYAAQQGDVDAVKRIIRAQPPSISSKDRTGKSTLHYCSTSDSIRAAQAADLVLMAAPDLVDSRDEDGFTPLHLAVIAGNMQLVTFLLANNADVNAVDNEKHTVVHWATVCGETAALRAVLAAGAPVSTPDVHGGYPLHYAAQMCGGDRDSGLGLQVLQTLLAHGDIVVNVADGDKRQPLLWAASAGSAKAVLALIRAGAAVEAADKDGLTALHCAASRGHTDCMDTLLTLCGASPDVIDSNGCTALHYAVTLGHADATALLLAHGADPNRQDRKGRSPPHCGCAKGQFETVKMIGSHGANLWLRNARGDLPLHDAAASGRRELVKWLLEMRPSQVNARNNDGRCPLHMAALHDNADMCKILLDAGAQVNPILRTSKNTFMTPMDCALQRGYRSTAKFLQLHGGIPASRMGDQRNQNVNTALNLQIRDDVTFWGDTSTDSERENGEVGEKNERKNYRKKFAHKFQRKRLSLSGSDKDNARLSSGGKDNRARRKTSGKGSSSILESPSSKRMSSRKLTSSRLDYTNEIIINGKTEINIHQTKEIIIDRDPSQEEVEIVEKTDRKVPAEKERRPRSAKCKMRNKSGRSSIEQEIYSKVLTPESSTAKEDRPRDLSLRDQSTNTSEETVETVIENHAMKTSTKDKDEVKEETVSSLPQKIPQTELKQQHDQQSIISNTSEDLETQKDLVVEAAVHEPPKFIKSETKAGEGLSAAAQIDTLKDDEVKMEPSDIESTNIDNESVNEDCYVNKLKDSTAAVTSTDIEVETESKHVIPDESMHQHVLEVEGDVISKETEVIESPSPTKMTETEPLASNAYKDDITEGTHQEVVAMKYEKDHGQADENQVGDQPKDIEKEDHPETKNKLIDPEKKSIEEKTEAVVHEIERDRESKIKDITDTDTTGQTETLDDVTVDSHQYVVEPTKNHVTKIFVDLSGNKLESEKQENIEELSSERDKKIENSNKNKVHKVTLKENKIDKKTNDRIEKEKAKIVKRQKQEEKKIYTDGDTDKRKTGSKMRNMKMEDNRKNRMQVKRNEPNEEEVSSFSDESLETPEEEKLHKSFKVLDETEAFKVEKKKIRKGRLKRGSARELRSKSEESKQTKLKKSKIPTPVFTSKLSKSDKYLDRVHIDQKSDRLDVKMPSLPNIHDERHGLGEPPRCESNMSAPVQASLYSDNERDSASDAEEDRSTTKTRRKVKRRSRTRDARSAGSDYESSNLIDSGFEPSPRSTRIPRWKNMSEKGVNMTSVTQNIQNNIRRYHLERKIFQHLLELKRHQIRAGQHNESVLVKRAIDAYHQSCASTVGAGKYVAEDYTFKSFEKFLYEALRKLQKNGMEYMKGLPAGQSNPNPLLCTRSTNRCMHATHAYTGVPCAAYLPVLNHHSIPKIGFDSASCKPGTRFLPNINCKKAVTLELSHGADKQVISLPTDRLDQNKRYYVTFTVKGKEPSPEDEDSNDNNISNAHTHSRSD